MQYGTRVSKSMEVGYLSFHLFHAKAIPITKGTQQDIDKLTAASHH